MKKLFDRLFSSLVFKIALSIVIVETILLGLFGGYYVQYFGAEIDRRIVEQISAPGRLIQDEQLKISVISDPQQMELLLGPHLREAMAIGFDGTIYHALDPLKIGTSVDNIPNFPRNELRADMTGQVLFPLDGPDGHNIVSITPLFSLNANQPFLYVYFKVSTRGLEESQRQMQSVLLIGSLMCIFLTSALIFLITQQTVLSRLINAAKFVSDIQIGKLSSRMTPMGKDEIGALERGLNAMAASLERRTQQHQIAQDALRDSEERFRDFTMSSADWYWEMGPDLKIAFASYKFYQLIEEIKGSLQGQSFDNLGLKAEMTDGWRYLNDQLERQLPFQRFEFSWTSRSGEKNYGRLNGVPVFELDGTFKGYRGTGSDITAERHAAEEQQMLQRQLATSQKLEAVGQMAGGVAHEFNNCLAGILSFAEVARAKADETERVKEYLDHVISLGERATSVADQLLMFSRRRIDQPTTVNVEHVFCEMEKLLTTLLEHRIDLQIWCDMPDLHTRVDPTQLSACLLNLAINARDAMPDGGTLQMSCSSVDIPPASERSADPELPRYPVDAVGRHVVITVQDTGTGIPDDILGNIFEPFFSTKPPGKGTGLGLPIVHSWVEQTGGFIDVESIEGVGTTFSIYLPRSDARSEQAPAATKVESFPGHGECVLIVDDEPALRTTAQIILEDAGFKAITASSAEDALTILERSATDGPHIDVILTDVVMAGISGPKLVIEALRTNTSLKFGVVFMSGYPAQSRQEMDKLLGDYIFLKKPFRPAQLQKAIHDALALRAEKQRL